MRLRGISARAVVVLGLASLVLVAVIVVAPMPASAQPTDAYSYNAAGGAPTPGPGGADDQTSITLGAAPTQSGFTFDGWNDGNATYGAGTGYVLNSDGGAIVFTAQWTANATDNYSYASGGGTGTAPTGGSGLGGTTINLAANTFTRAGYTFDGWNDGNATYGAGTGYVLNSDGGAIVFTAQWTANATDNFSYNAAGGAPTPAAGSGLNGTSITLASAPTRAGSVFDGWNDGTSTYAASISYPLSSGGVAIVFTAQWTANATGGGPPPTTLDQTSPTSGVTTSDNSGTFTGGPITVSNATGAVSFVITSSSIALRVSPQGAITTSGTLLAGSYRISGADSDPNGDTGTWTFTLTVSTPITVTFVANGGQGSMSPETKSAPTALTPNVFTRAKHAFTKWNTAADGSGTSYVNGATYSFIAPVTLYAQWTATTHRAVSHRVTFDANGGTSTMAVQSNSVLTLLKSNAFTRAGYNFKGWNTKADGSGTSYADGAAYSFAKSTTLYAQWTRKVTIKVTFDANGGTGTMAVQSNSVLTLLKTNAFTRAGYTFKSWNTTANGSGTSYANGAVYSFAKSAILYAQWAKKAVVIIPAVHGVVTLSPFVGNSATLSSTLEAQVTVLAADVKANHDTKIALMGFSGNLTWANESNEEVSATSLKLALARADAVETFLEQQLATIGVTGYTITAKGSIAALPVSSNATAASQAKNRKVVATLT
jgi:uncharacterized repeat protein (TIGR02543 family)